MLKFTNLILRRGTRVLVRDAAFAIHAGQRVGVTGANGAGKSSLFALIRGELSPDAGEFSAPPDWVIAHVAQETPAVDTPAIDYVMDGDAELRAVERALAQAEAGGDGAALGELHARLGGIGGYGAHARAARLMHGLGFAGDQQTLPVRSFSGGWRMRLNLARALMCRSDLLLLDEPTNHLDLDAVLWLEDWLASYPGTLLLISHDRDFLDRVVNHILHIEQERADLQSGNYSDYELRRAERMAQQQVAFERQQREIAHIQSFVDRFRAKATKARQAQSRLKALARMELLAPAHVDSPFRFRFLAPEKLPHPLLALEKVAAGYGEHTVVAGASAVFAPGARIGLLGQNGAGKSTFVKLLAGTLAPVAGKRAPAPDLRIGYFAQHQLEMLDPQASPLLHMQRLDGRATEQDLRDFLGGFGFVGDRALAPVAPFSGGEKARLALALVVYQRPNLLLLDEPTNHLDIDMRHALTVALQDYEGALVLVSHDRHLLRSVADEFWVVGEGRAQSFDGDLEDYRVWLAQRLAHVTEETGDKDNSAGARKDRRREEAEKRERLRPLKKDVERCEKRLDECGRNKARVDVLLADPAIYDERNKEDLKVLLRDQAAADQALAEAEDAWLAAVERLEVAQRDG
ncbi:MAG: ATP-binding cassette domain-containing protein [Thiohalomonadaceae bacterium]